jgi:hypothetical protein
VRPVTLRDGHDLPRLIDERVPGVAAVIDDVVEGFEDSVREPILAHEQPDILLAVELGRARRQRQERDIAWDFQVLRTVPTSLIEDENGVRAGGNLGGDFFEMKLHGFAVTGRQHQCGAGPTLGADRPEQIGRLGALIVDGAGPRAPTPIPAVGSLTVRPKFGLPFHFENWRKTSWHKPTVHRRTLPQPWSVLSLGQGLTGGTMIEHSAAAAAQETVHVGLKLRMQCPECKERFEAGKRFCYCNELHRRRFYDEERERRGLTPLYRPPSMR